MKISIEDLESLFQKLKAELIIHFGNEVEIKAEDFYWEVDESEMYNPSQKPTDLSLGQLSDDWNDLLRLKDDDEIPISWDLRRLAAILQAIQANSANKW